MSHSRRNPKEREAFFRARSNRRIDDSRSTCEAAKFAYRMRRDAEKARDSMRAKMGEDAGRLDVYRCGQCDWFHVGKSKWRNQ